MNPAGARAGFYTLIGDELCASVSTLLYGATAGLTPLFPTGLSGVFDDGLEVEAVRGPGVLTRVSLTRDDASVVFRQSRHLSGARIMERIENGPMPGAIAVAATRHRDQCDLFSLVASLGTPPNGEGDPHLFLMPQVHSGFFVFDFTDEPGTREADFCLMSEGRGYRATGYRRNDVILCDLDPDSSRFLGSVGLNGVTRIEVHGLFTSTLRAMARGLRLVFFSGDRVVGEFPTPRPVFGPVI